MGSIRRISDSGNGGTEGVKFIQFIDGQEPQIHEIWCLSYDGVTCEVHPTAQTDVVTGTVGQLTTNCLAENGRRIPVIGQLSINESVKLLGIPSKAWGRGLPFIKNFQAPTVLYGWGVADTSNQNWGIILGGPYSNAAVFWGRGFTEIGHVPKSREIYQKEPVMPVLFFRSFIIFYLR